MTDKEIRKFFKNERIIKRNDWKNIKSYDDKIKDLAKQPVYKAIDKIKENCFDYGFEAIYFDISNMKEDIIIPLAQVESKYGNWKIFFNKENNKISLHHHNYSLTRENGYIESSFNEDNWHVQKFNGKKEPKSIGEIFEYIYKHDKTIRNTIKYYGFSVSQQKESLHIKK